MEKSRKSIALLFVLALAINLSMVGNARADPLTKAEILPETTVVGLGEYFTVNISLSDTINVFGLQFVLRYDSNILELTDVDPHLPTQVLVGEEITGIPTVWMGYDCDVVQDEVLDVLDLVAIGAAFGSQPGYPSWNPRADINKDNKVDLWDLSYGILAMSNTIAENLGAIQFWSIQDDPWQGGSYATITFKSIGIGETTLDLDNMKMCLGSSEPVPHDVADGVVVVSAEKTVQNLIPTVESMSLPKGTENTLTSKLEAAAFLLSQNNLNAAAHKLEDFIKNVEALRGKKLTDEQADILIARVQEILIALE